MCFMTLMPCTWYMTALLSLTAIRCWEDKCHSDEFPLYRCKLSHYIHIIFAVTAMCKKQTCICTNSNKHTDRYGKGFIPCNLFSSVCFILLPKKPIILLWVFIVPHYLWSWHCRNSITAINAWQSLEEKTSS